MTTVQEGPTNEVVTHLATDIFVFMNWRSWATKKQHRHTNSVNALFGRYKKKMCCSYVLQPMKSCIQFIRSSMWTTTAFMACNHCLMVSHHGLRPNLYATLIEGTYTCLHLALSFSCLHLPPNSTLRATFQQTTVQKCEIPGLKGRPQYSS